MSGPVIARSRIAGAASVTADGAVSALDGFVV